jgi:hypothetical protein
MKRAMISSTVAWTVLLQGILMTSPAAAQPAADSAAIRRTALDYARAWYTGDAALMQSALHPELAKRIVRDFTGRPVLDHINVDQLLEITARGVGRLPPEERLTEVRILSIFGNAASVALEMKGFTDFMHMARWEDRWLVINVLWAIAPRVPGPS